MKAICKPISWISLLLIIIPPFLYFSNTIGEDLLKSLLAVGTLVWFVTASLWMWNSE
ncbi:hypothetical protein SH580_06165 [Coraliomargarita algicola]|uniref:YqaE/Pmp3 family membrane protein n=1 Tax=Coraliomargarita algicola TaxID=3092156 RepID=A0ABZ0RPD9_9BACT|nr:hypothetical protein [Coraliomargarita sp. J2-16]WPJ97291.1 hypothetical protein SH580_06165 [Coraliomargarita sp. J2-16]